MPPLAELQRDFARSLLAGGTMPAATTGRLSPAQALRVHRNTVLAALVQALRLAHPTVDALVGEAFFDQAASAFALLHPPRTASLGLYGEAFAAFLETFPPAGALPYLGDVARLDFAIERAAQGPAAQRIFALDARVRIALPAGLILLWLRHPADAIRAAIADDAALAVIDLTPAAHVLLVWRNGPQARTRRVDAAAGLLLEALLDGQDAQQALAACPDPALLQDQVFSASFCTILPNPETPP